MEWIRTEDQLPKPYERVIVARVFGKDKPLQVEQGMLISSGWWKVYGKKLRKVPYWMPLPAPPEGTE